MSIFLKFDLFTSSSFFFYDLRKKVATYPGLLASGIIYALLLYSFINSNMIQRKNPQISDEMVAVTDGNIEMFLSNDNFFLTFNIFDDELNDYTYLDPSIWTLSLRNSQNDTTLPIEFFNCTSIGMSDVFDGYLCLDNSTILELSYNSTSSTNLEIILSLCSNSSSEVICKPYKNFFHSIC